MLLDGDPGRSLSILMTITREEGYCMDSLMHWREREGGGARGQL